MKYDTFTATLYSEYLRNEIISELPPLEKLLNFVALL